MYDRIIRNLKYQICCIKKQLSDLDETIFFSNIGTNGLLPLAVPGILGKLYIDIDTGEQWMANPSGLAPYYLRVGKDVIEVVNFAALPVTGSTSVVYVTLDDNKLYRWTGSVYVEVSAQDNNPNVQTVTSAATVTPTFSNDLVIIESQSVGLTIANPTGDSVDGKSLIIKILDNGTPQSINYGTDYRAIGVTLPTTTVANKTTYLGMVYTNIDGKFDIIGVTTQA
jgi:hypothetical protein